MNRKLKKLKPHTKLILNIIAIALMATGPVLMILPGPQVLSWLGLALFIYVNKTWLRRFKWFRKLELNLNLWKIDRKLKKIERKIKKSF